MPHLSNTGSAVEVTRQWWVPSVLCIGKRTMSAWCAKPGNACNKQREMGHARFVSIWKARACFVTINWIATKTIHLLPFHFVSWRWKCTSIKAAFIIVPNFQKLKILKKYNPFVVFLSVSIPSLPFNSILKFMPVSYYSWWSPGLLIWSIELCNSYMNARETRRVLVTIEQGTLNE